jgi:hypothetical protein
MSSANDLASAQKRLASRRFDLRREAVRTLQRLNRHDLILEHAMGEEDMRVLDAVEKCFSPEPKELIQRMATVVRGMDNALWLRFRATTENYLYAEDTIYGILAKKRLLKLDEIEATGLGYWRSCGQLLRKYLKGRMIDYPTARKETGPRAVSGVYPPDASTGDSYWSRESKAAILAAQTLARLDVEFDIDQVQRMLREVPQAMAHQQGAASTIGTLKWVLFDQRANDDLDELIPYIKAGHGGIGPDLALTLVKRKRFDELRPILMRGVTYEEDGITMPLWIGSVFTQPAFCYWPVMDWLEHEGLFHRNRNGRDGYRKGRAEKQDPPPWWKWLEGPLPAMVTWIPGPWKGRLGIVPVPLAGEGLIEEIDAWRTAGIDTVVSLMTHEDASRFELSNESAMCCERGLEFIDFPVEHLGLLASVEPFAIMANRLDAALASGRHVALHSVHADLLARCVVVQSGRTFDEANNIVANAGFGGFGHFKDEKQWIQRFVNALAPRSPGGA